MRKNAYFHFFFIPISFKCVEVIVLCLMYLLVINSLFFFKVMEDVLLVFMPRLVFRRVGATKTSFLPWTNYFRGNPNTSQCMQIQHFFIIFIIYTIISLSIYLVSQFWLWFLYNADIRWYDCRLFWHTLGNIVRHTQYQKYLVDKDSKTGHSIHRCMLQ